MCRRYDMRNVIRILVVNLEQKIPLETDIVKCLLLHILHTCMKYVTSVMKR
jgi:hypothetical protein